MLELIAEAPDAYWRGSTESGDRRRLTFGGGLGESEGAVQVQPNVNIGSDDIRDLLVMRPPRFPNSFVQGFFFVDVPQGGELQGAVGLLPGAPLSDGVRFRVLVHYRERPDSARVNSRRFDFNFEPGRDWTDFVADLSYWEGQRIMLSLVVFSGNSPTQDWAAWSGLQIIENIPHRTAQKTRFQPERLTVIQASDELNNGVEPMLVSMLFTSEFTRAGSTLSYLQSDLHQLGSGIRSNESVQITDGHNLAIEHIFSRATGLGLAVYILVGIERDLLGRNRASRALKQVQAQMEQVFIEGVESQSLISADFGALATELEGAATLPPTPPIDFRRAHDLIGFDARIFLYGTLANTAIQEVAGGGAYPIVLLEENDFTMSLGNALVPRAWRIEYTISNTDR